MTDLRQDIMGCFVFSRCLNETFPWRKCSIKALVSWHRREDLYLLLFSFGLMYQCLYGAIPSWKFSIKAPAKWRNSVYVLTEICHQRSKWLGPWSDFWCWSNSNALIEASKPPWSAIFSDKIPLLFTNSLTYSLLKHLDLLIKTASNSFGHHWAFIPLASKCLPVSSKPWSS